MVYRLASAATGHDTGLCAEMSLSTRYQLSSCDEIVTSRQILERPA